MWRWKIKDERGDYVSINIGFGLLFPLPQPCGAQSKIARRKTGGGGTSETFVVAKLTNNTMRKKTTTISKVMSHSTVTVVIHRKARVTLRYHDNTSSNASVVFEWKAWTFVAKSSEKQIMFKWNTTCVYLMPFRELRYKMKTYSAVISCRLRGMLINWHSEYICEALCNCGRVYFPVTEHSEWVVFFCIVQMTCLLCIYCFSRVSFFHIIKKQDRCASLHATQIPRRLQEIKDLSSFPSLRLFL